MARGLRRRMELTDVAYVTGRLTVAFSLILMYVLGLITSSPESGMPALLRWGLLLFAITGVGVMVGDLVLGLSTRIVLWSALPFDIVSAAMLLVATHHYEDAIFAWLVGLVAIYAVGLRRSEVMLVSALIAAGYVAAHLYAAGDTADPGTLVLLGFKGATLVLLGYFVSGGMTRQLQREADLEASHDDVETLNRQLQRRLSELNAVSEITEVIHSSLDFDAIGPLVLEIIQKVIDVPACSLLVLDKQKAETLFSATAGLGSAPALPRALDPEAADQGMLETEGGLFSCLTILDHGQMMVVFCAAAEQMEQMRLEDRLVLQAVASELAVAVENSQLYKLTKRLSITDELTGLYNYRYLQQRLEDEFGRARRYDRPLSLLMLDADDFKKFNDRNGHVAGDAALGEIGALLKASVREIDVPARYGGEEFSVVLPETDAAGAFVVAEKIRETIAEHAFADGDGARTVHITLSIGLATFPVHADDREALLRQSDDALYQAKHSGRDRVRAAQPLIRSVDDDPSGEQALDHGRPA